MKQTLQILPFVTLVFFVVNFLLLSDAISEDNNCSIRCTVSALFIIVQDVHPDQGRGRMLWSGELEAQQQVSLKSTHGRFYYEYSTDPKARTSLAAGTIQFCKDGETVDVP
jgi:hypothetical protein